MLLSSTRLSMFSTFQLNSPSASAPTRRLEPLSVWNERRIDTTPFLAAYERYASEYLGSLQKVLGAGTLRARLTAYFDAAIKNFRSGSPPRGCPTTRGLMELGSVEGDGLDENARQAFADLVARVTALVQDALSEGAERGEFKGDTESAALHIVTVTRGLAVLERAFGDEAQLRKIAKHTVDLVLGKAGR